MAKITALAPWYGGDRMICDEIGKLLDGCEWVGVPFAGGMSAIKAIRARTIVANDLHLQIIDLCEVVSNKIRCERLQEWLRQKPFHPETLERAQLHLSRDRYDNDQLSRAGFYFIVCWMTRSGTAGTPAEQTAGLSVRWEAGGGDSVKRYHSAIDSLSEWCEEFKRCTFTCLDVFDFLEKCKDRAKHGMYVDPPFPGPGDKYKHQFDQHEELSHILEHYKETKLVVRYYDTQLVHKLYPEWCWHWHPITGRKQTNAEAPEVLITNF